MTPTPDLEKLAAVRDQVTVFSGVSHPGVTGGHAAERIGDQTRHPSLVRAMSNEATLRIFR